MKNFPLNTAHATSSAFYPLRTRSLENQLSTYPESGGETFNSLFYSSHKMKCNNKSKNHYFCIEPDDRLYRLTQIRHVMTEDIIVNTPHHYFILFQWSWKLDFNESFNGSWICFSLYWIEDDHLTWHVLCRGRALTLKLVITRKLFPK